MLRLFQRKRALARAVLSPVPATVFTKGLLQPESATSLLATSRRQKLLEYIWQRTSLSRRQFVTLYRVPLERYAELVQRFPASESHHHAYPGGMLDHGLEIVAYALKLRQSHLLPAGASPEDQAVQSEAWTAAVAYAALLHDIGKIAVDLHVELANGSTWHPWHGPLREPYRFRYCDGREYRLHSAATGLLYRQVIDREVLDWLSGHSELWGALLYVLAGQYEHAGALGELVILADRASVAQELGGDPTRAMTAPKHALQRKLVDGLRYLLKEELKLNQPEASDGWLTEDSLWLVSKTVSDKLRAHLLSQGIDGIPANNTAVFNVLQDHRLLQATPDGRAIWRATVTSSTGWTHTFTLLRLSPSLIWEPAERPLPFAGTVEEEMSASQANNPGSDAGSVPGSTTCASSSPIPVSIATSTESSKALSTVHDTASITQLEAGDVVGDLMALMGESPGLASSPMEASAIKPSVPANLAVAASTALERCDPPQVPPGECFVSWLGEGINSHRLIINDAKALVHIVDNTVFMVSPGIFQRYVQEYPEIALVAKQEDQQGWQWVQKRFEKMQLHRKQPNGLNVWACLVTGPRKSRRLYGYLLKDTKLLHDTPPNNPHLSLC